MAVLSKALRAAEGRSAPAPARSGVRFGMLTRDPLLLGLVALFALSFGWFHARVGGTTGQIRAFWAVQPPLDLVVVWLSYRLVRMPDVAAPVRRFWRGMIAGSVVLFVGDSIQLVVSLHQTGSAAATSSPAQMVFICAGASIVAWTMLTHPVLTEGRNRLRVWLDSLTIMVTGGTFAWFLSAPDGFSAIGDLVGPIASSVIMLIVIYGITRLMYGGVPSFTNGAGIAGVLTTAALGVTALLPPVPDRYLWIALPLRLLSSIFFAAVPRIQALQLGAGLSNLELRARRSYSRVPYIALVGVNVLLVVALFSGEVSEPRVLGVLVGVLISSGLVLGRQLVAFGDNTRLLGQLDASMLEVSRREQRFRSLVQHASDITVITVDHTIHYASPAMERVLGLLPDEVTGAPAEDLLHPDDRAEVRAALAEAEPGRAIVLRVRARHADGTWRWLEVVLTDLSADPSVGGYVFNCRDITETKQLHDRLQHQAHHDPLTGLANRALFDSRMAALRGEPGQHNATVLLIDLDGFKGVNDTYGHHVGDALLVAVAQRLTACVRASDTVARLGGDEFAILLPMVPSSEVSTLTRRIIDSLAEPLAVDGHSLPIYASIGASAGDPADAERLLREADAAMYAVKRGAA